MARAGVYSPDAVVYSCSSSGLCSGTDGVQPCHVRYIVIWPFQETSEDYPAVLVAGVVMVIGVNGARIPSQLYDRHKVLQQSFPEVLDLMLICRGIRPHAGCGARRVCREMKKSYPVIISELEHTRVEINVLNDRVLALQNLAERTDISGFKHWFRRLSRRKDRQQHVRNAAMLSPNTVPRACCTPKPGGAHSYSYYYPSISLLCRHSCWC